MILLYILMVIGILVVIAIAAVFYIFLKAGFDRYDRSQAAYKAQLEEIADNVKKRGRVTDPFDAANKTNTIGASSDHIVIRKTPDQIRNENFERIQKGQNYGPGA